MIYTTYVIEDERGERYKGVTSDLERRMKEHILGKTKTTRSMGKLRIIYKEEFDTFKKARAREVYFKSAAGRRFLKKVLQ